MAAGSIKAELSPEFPCFVDAILDYFTCMHRYVHNSVLLSTQLGVSAVVNNEDDDDSSELEQQ